MHASPIENIFFDCRPTPTRPVLEAALELVASGG
jgi:hypothetical protein